MSLFENGVVKEYLAGAALIAAFGLIGCSGGGGGSAPPPSAPPPTSHSVTLSWSPNRETAVNSAGGGYTVNISGQAPISIPYVSGPLAPTSTTVTLLSGTYTVTVVAFSALNPPGGGSGSTSAQSAPLTVNVPF